MSSPRLEGKEEGLEGVKVEEGVRVEEGRGVEVEESWGCRWLGLG